jgi:hypothetical protein
MSKTAGHWLSDHATWTGWFRGSLAVQASSLCVERQDSVARTQERHESGTSPASTRRDYKNSSVPRKKWATATANRYTTETPKHCL